MRVLSSDVVDILRKSAQVSKAAALNLEPPITLRLTLTSLDGSNADRTFLEIGSALIRRLPTVSLILESKSAMVGDIMENAATATLKIAARVTLILRNK
jgi:hypothetical protein